jgi:YegS/Rv2252/BmrU family lipid kinase
MRVKVILNPWSNRGRAREQVDKIIAMSRQYEAVDLVLTERPGHARTLAREAADQGYGLVVAAGGDGTVHEVINGLVRGDRADVPLGVLPIGSGNDFAFAAGIPLDLELAMTRLFSGAPQTVDLGRVENERGRYEFFHNNLGIGFDAVVVIRSEAITRIQGFLMYFVAVLQTILLYYQTHQFELRFDEELVRQESLFLALGVGPRGGGGFLLTPNARQNDDLIDSCLVNPVGRLTMLSMLLRVMKGTHVTSPHVTMRQNRRILVRSQTPLPVHVDGEVFAYPRDGVYELTITSVPAAVRVMR